jgi:hypothetical protein
MEEIDYIMATDLAKIRAIKSILRDITPENNPYINNTEFERINSNLSLWENSINSDLVIKF